MSLVRITSSTSNSPAPVPPVEDLGEHRAGTVRGALAGPCSVDVEQLVIAAGDGRDGPRGGGGRRRRARSSHVRRLVGHHLGRSVEEQLGDVGPACRRGGSASRGSTGYSALGDAGRRGDLLHRHALVAVLDDEPLGSVEDLAQAHVRRSAPKRWTVLGLCRCAWTWTNRDPPAVVGQLTDPTGQSSITIWSGVPLPTPSRRVDPDRRGFCRAWRTSRVRGRSAERADLADVRRQRGVCTAANGNGPACSICAR